VAAFVILKTPAVSRVIHEAPPEVVVMTTANFITEDDREEIVGNLKAVIADVEELLDATTTPGSDRLSGTARARFQATLRSARERLAGLDERAIDRAREYARNADDYVREHPWGAVGIGAVAGLLLGVMASASRR
jgi:ElaB/YqjD/DUF883 family membrane-anchored ribosome-binding protein